MDLSGIDFQVFQYINHLAVKIPLLNPLMRFLSEDAKYLFYLGIIVYWFTRVKQNRQMVAEALISACLALGAGGAISYFFYRDRPFVHHAVNQLIQHPANASFPSDHALGAFVIATAIYLYRKRDGGVWFILAAMIGISRIWTGVHYPLDVIAGALLGMIAALAVHQAFNRWFIAQKCWNMGIDFYEKIEQRIWRRDFSKTEG
ncbi:undecaprenyl-diphosphatase [Paenibacillus filicis]|uniref:Undecaprenyl-diphosphatase n=1 Tax=Paenibacillus gyeongsangnamensis TaxID=3388067 RepID=A0ABT4QDX3_9BACL|nr:undecaprenyl-diphosphatase [Paenibacillus filicis]MCZ8515074.1 undecaprenyl-diphosphatase [Paenibacillus filicis]